MRGIKALGVAVASLAALAQPWPAAAEGPASATRPLSPAPAAAEAVVPRSPGRPTAADFRGEFPSDDARRVADWVVVSRDNQGLSFIIIDKLRAKVFVFDSVGRLRGASVALLGRARGDDSEPGIGARKLHSIRPEERTTPAGRFVASIGRDFQHDVLWIDYAAALSLHRVVTGDPGDHRLQRLGTASTRDKRISYGCVNVPAKFYDDVVLPTVGDADSVVYILPEVKTIREVFAISDVDVRGAGQ